MVYDPTNEEHRERNREYQRRYYKANREKHLARVAQNNRRRRKEANSLILKYKKSGCSTCGEEHPATLDFHHVYPEEKEVTISSAVMLGWSLERIRIEIEKCIILCANCHRKLHWEERNL